MEQSTQSSGQQQNRQQPVYDIRNGGHYGIFIPNSRNSRSLVCADTINLYRRQRSCKYSRTLDWKDRGTDQDAIAFGARICACRRFVLGNLVKCEIVPRRIPPSCA